MLKTMFSVLLGSLLFCVASSDNLVWSAEKETPSGNVNATVCKVLADRGLEDPLVTIGEEYGRLTGFPISLNFLAPSEVNALVKKKETGCDVVFSILLGGRGAAALESLPGATTVAWKYPSMEPVCAAVLTMHPEATRFVRFAGGPTGHRLWSESSAGFTITPDTSAEAYEWVAEHRIKHTYAMSAMRILAECGGIRDGVCIDIGCGGGHLDVELAKRSNFRIIGLDIDSGAKPLFEKRMREAGLQDRVSFVLGDAQKMPFADDYADVIISRGTLVFIPDIAKCLREADRVLKASGVAFLGGRYVYTPQPHKISTEKLKEIVRKSGVSGAEVIDDRGQWVKIIGPEAPKGAFEFQGGPHMLANRFVGDFGITQGKVLLICQRDSMLQQGLQRGFLDITDLEITALYHSEEVAGQAEKRVRRGQMAKRITCKAGSLQALPFSNASFDLVAGVGPVLLMEKDREKAMREVYRVLRAGGGALLGGRLLYMDDDRKVPTETLRQMALRTGIPSIRVYDDMGQWVEIRKGIRNGDGS
ncbi:MAG: methyltransferase domain-containing protein [Thermodesulfobacteriota bacterium]|nr:methyltransferase domain-containing protein [Thermodesulfobacteriota bacterium]